jgi:hypothetical protein
LSRDLAPEEAGAELLGAGEPGSREDIMYIYMYSVIYIYIYIGKLMGLAEGFGCWF